MKTALRVIAASIGLFVLVPFLLLVWHFVDVASGHTRPGMSAAAWLILVSLVAFIAFAVFAMYRLWQLRQSGRRAAIGVLVLVMASLVASALHGFATSLWSLTLACAAMVALLLPQARKVCS